MRTLMLCVCFAGFATTLSAHVIKGLESPTLATALVSSPSSGTDALLPIRWGTVDTGVRVACFNVANTSPERLDRRGWPRVAGVGFELPGTRSGFTLIEPADGNWDLVEDVGLRLLGTAVTLDFALVARPGHLKTRGISPGQPAVRGSGTRFCVSGPFPDEITAGQQTTIEQVINGVVVGFVGVAGNGNEFDLGVWDNPARIIPLFP